MNDDPVTVVTLPQTSVEFPEISNFKIMIPAAGKLEKMVIAEEREDANYARNFTQTELTQVATNDPNVFANGDIRVIDLSDISVSQYAFPLAGAKMISPYGGRRRHSGVDLKTCPNDTIVAAFDGVVRMSQRYAGYGYIVVIRHSNGMETLYSHQSKNLVKPGEFVSAGQPVGLTGRTGRASTEHLHFEIRINGQHINPATVFDMASHELKSSTLVCRNSGRSTSIKSFDVLPDEYASYVMKHRDAYLKENID